MARISARSSSDCTKESRGSAVGRFDGECWNIGFLDVCNRPYDPLCDAARASHGRMYAVASGQVAPFHDAPESLPKLFL